MHDRHTSLFTIDSRCIPDLVTKQSRLPRITAVTQPRAPQQNGSDPERGFRMHKTDETAPPVFRVIDGGGRTKQRTLPTLPPAPGFCAEELAAEMSVLFALALAQDTPLPLLHDPHTVLDRSRSDEATLHDLLCELRNLRWFDAEQTVSSAKKVASSPARQDETDRRRSLYWNGDGQLTLRTLTRGGVVLRGIASRNHTPLRIKAHPVPGHGDAETPGPDAPLDAWQHWCAGERGARSCSSPQSTPQADATLRALAQEAQRMPAAQPFFGAALDALAGGSSLDPHLTGAALAQGSGWTGSRVLSLMAEAETLALRLAGQRGRHADRLTRPVVTAARMSVCLAQEEMLRRTDATIAAADELAEAAPRLLDWVGKANLASRGPLRFARSLFLPLCPVDAIPPHPADLNGHALVAGALATVIKACFDTAPLRNVDRDQQARCLAHDVDRLCSDIALARCVAATHFPAENHQDLRIGEALALGLLRDALEEDNRDAALSLTGFDGQRLDIRGSGRFFGRGHVALRIDGQPAQWPLTGTDRAHHLTAVS